MIKNKKIQTLRKDHRIFTRSLSFLQKEMHKSQRIPKKKLDQNLMIRKVVQRTPSQYFLYAQCLIAQLQEQFDLSVLKETFFHSKIQEILTVLKKCANSSKGLIYIKIVNLHGLQKLKIPDHLYASVEQIIKYVKKLKENPTKMQDLFIIDKFDETLRFLYENFPNKQSEMLSLFTPLISIMKVLSAQLKELLPKKRLYKFLSNLNYWNIIHQKNIIKKASQCEKVPEVNSQRSSFCSVTSEDSSAYEQRLRKFNETGQFFLSNQKLKKNSNRYSRVVNIPKIPKRISSNWSKGQSNHIKASTENIKKNSLFYSIGKSRLKNQHEQVLQEESMSKNNVMTKCHSNTQADENLENFNINSMNSMNSNKSLFSLFVDVKEILRRLDILSVENVTGKIVIKFGGYFTQSLTIKRATPINVMTQFQQLVEFIMANVQIKNKGVWKTLHAKFKPQLSLQREKKGKIIISQPIEDYDGDSTYRYGFIKNMNVYFFTKIIKNHDEYQNEDTLKIYDRSYEDLIETVSISQKSALKIFKGSLIQKTEKKIQKWSEIGLVDCNIKQREIPQAKWGESQGIQKLGLHKRYKNNSNFFRESIKTEGKYYLIEKQINLKKSTISISNSKFEHRYRYLNRIGCNSGNIPNSLVKLDVNVNAKLDELKNSFLIGLNKKKNYSMRSVINRRAPVPPEFVNLKYDYSFIKNVKNVGYVFCKILIFKPELTELIFFEVYVQQNQKYYYFPFKPSVLMVCVNLEHNNLTSERFRECMSYFIKIVKLFTCSRTTIKGQLELIIQIGETRVFGKQLLARVCHVNKDDNDPTIVDFICKSTESRFEMKREIYEISKRLRNYTFENIYEEKFDKFLKFRHKYSEIINEAKQILMRRSPGQFDRKNLTNHCYFINEDLKTLTKISKLEGQWVASIAGDNSANYKRVVNLGELNKNRVFRALEKRALSKYMKRILKDPLCSHMLFQRNY